MVIVLTYYRLPTKLRESNVFSRMCLSLCLFTEGVGSCTVQFGLYCTPPRPDIFKLVPYEACTASKRAVGILLECFFVIFMESAE